MNIVTKKIKKRRRRRLLFLTVLTIVVLKACLGQDDSEGENKATSESEESIGQPVQVAPSLNEQLIKTYPTYHIKAALDETNFQITGEVDVLLNNPGTNTILFYAYPYWAPIEIINVQFNGQPTAFKFDGKNLTINNPSKQQSLRIGIQFETPVPQVGTRFGVKDNVWLITTWYPILGVLDDQRKWIQRPTPIGRGDPFYFRFANYTVEWTSSTNIQWLSSGRLESEVVLGETKTQVWKVDQVRNFALIGSPDYIIKKFQLNDKTTVSIAVDDETNLERVERIARSLFPLFSKIYGELPYTDVAVAETSNQTNYALEYPNLAIFSKDMYENDKIEHWIPHEIGHTWWYNAVGVNETVNGWLDEGMAEHGVVWYLENRYSKERGDQLWDQFRSEHQRLQQTSPNQTMDVGLYGFSNFTEYDISWYSRAADMFLTFRQALGDEKYIQFLNELYRANLGKVADEQSLNQALAESLGLKTDFFGRWLHDSYARTQSDVSFTEISKTP